MREPGVIVTESDVAEYLKGKERYSTLYDNINKSYTEGVSSIRTGFGQNRASLGSDFTSSISNAFDASRNTRGQLLSLSGSLGTGARELARSDIERNASAAYDEYINNYFTNRQGYQSQMYSDLSRLETNTASAIAEVDKLLGQEASNWSSLIDSPKQYLNYLASNGLIDINSPEFGKFFTTTYVDGTPTQSLMSDAEFDALMYDTDNQGNKVLSQTGLDFYKQILYGSDFISGVPGYGAWLNETDSDLYNFYLQSGNEVFNAFNDKLVRKDYNGNYVVSGYSGDASTALKHLPTASYLDTPDFGNVYTFNSSNGAGKIYEFTSPKITGMNMKDISKNKAEEFDLKGERITYKLRINKNAEIASDTILNDISKQTGEIVNGWLYLYGNTLYLAEVSEGKTILRKVEFRDDESYNEFWNKVNNDIIFSDQKDFEERLAKIRSDAEKKKTPAHEYREHPLGGNRNNKNTTNTKNTHR